MQIQYNGEHAVIFELPDRSESWNTWTDWFLVPTTRPTVTMPTAQAKFIETPGVSGSEDISDYLTPNMTYGDRSGSFEFVVDTNQTDWIDAFRRVAICLHGMWLRMRLTDDPDFYYEGRFTLNEVKSEPRYSKIVIDYRVGPFKISVSNPLTKKL